MKIIIADDIFTNRLLLSEVISDLGHENLEAKNGKEAIDLLQKYDDIDLILLDIEMPVMNGLETAKYIREKMPAPKNKIPIIALTAHNPKIFFDDYHDAGFDQLLTKPYSIQKITMLLESLIKAE